MSHRVTYPEGSVILTPTDMKILYQVAKLGPLRSHYRTGNTRVYELLTELTVGAFTADADTGNEPRQAPASEEREWWTVSQIHRATGGRRAERTIRNDCSAGTLPALKNPTWLIRAEDARTYIAAHRPN